MIVPGLSSQLQKVSSVPALPQNNELSDSGEANPSEGIVEFASLQCIASGKTDTTGNLAYHVQEPDPDEGMMNIFFFFFFKIWWEKRQTKILAFH